MFENTNICNRFHWLLHLEKENKYNEDEVRDHYKEMYEEFMDIVATEHQEYYACIMIQVEFRNNTVKTAMAVRNCEGRVA